MIVNRIVLLTGIWFILLHPSDVFTLMGAWSCEIDSGSYLDYTTRHQGGVEVGELLALADVAPRSAFGGILWCRLVGSCSPNGLVI
jgi:hypothetical protein